jgi:hypothetical protein
MFYEGSNAHRCWCHIIVNKIKFQTINFEVSITTQIDENHIYIYYVCT